MVQSQAKAHQIELIMLFMVSVISRYNVTVSCQALNLTPCLDLSSHSCINMTQQMGPWKKKTRSQPSLSRRKTKCEHASEGRGITEINVRVTSLLIRNRSSSPLGSTKASPHELMSATAVTGSSRPAVIITEKGCWGQTSKAGWGRTS